MIHLGLRDADKKLYPKCIDVKFINITSDLPNSVTKYYTY